MLFDLQGKRRRLVQAVYLMLAVLMGGGLVFFGIGGDVSGGLFDAFSERGGGGSDDTIEKRIERNEERVAAGGAARENALKELVRDHYAVANNQAETGATGFPEEAIDDLENAAAAYQRYVKVETGTPDPATATYAIQIYDVTALNKPDEAKKAATIVAEAENDWPSYLRLVQYATLAQDTRTADLAGKKAIDLAGKGEKKEVRQQVKLAQQPQSGAPAGGTTTDGG